MRAGRDGCGMRPAHSDVRSPHPGTASLLGSVLASVSRSFYLSLKALPAGVRKPLGLAYLLARATDTLADMPGEVGARLVALDALARAIAKRSGEDADPPVDHPFAAFGDAPGVTAGERVLLARIDDCLALLETMSAADRGDIRLVLSRIVRGQRLDLVRFERGGPGICTAAELDEYTWLVAGCVGEFWTDVCMRSIPAYCRLDRAEMVRLGTDFGKGLQMVNILRDFPADLRKGRCYLPSGELRAAGVDPGLLARDPGAARHVFDAWWTRGMELLGQGRAYLHAVRSRRVRYACALPLRIGMATMDSVRLHFPAEGVKISRPGVRRLAVRSLLDAVWSC